MKTISRTSVLATLAVMSAGAQAGSFTLIPPGGFEIHAPWASLSSLVADFEQFDTLSPMIGVRNLSGYPQVSYSGGFYVTAEWNPSYPGEAPPSGVPFLRCETEAMIKCMPGAIGTVTYGSLTLASAPTGNTWVPLGPHYSESSQWFQDELGQWLAHFPVNTYQVNASASLDNYAVVKLRLNIVGVEML